MRLFDRVISEKGPVIIELDGRGQYMLPGSGTRARELRQCTGRYVLTPDMFEQTVVRVPQWDRAFQFNSPAMKFHARSFWIEWCAAESDQQFGILVNASRNLRSAQLHSFFSRPDGGADLNPIHIRFDIDAPLAERHDGRVRFRLDSKQAAPRLVQHALLCIDAGWADYYQATELGANAVAEVMRMEAESLAGDLLIALTFDYFVNALGQFDIERKPMWQRAMMHLGSGPAGVKSDTPGPPFRSPARENNRPIVHPAAQHPVPSRDAILRDLPR